MPILIYIKCNCLNCIDKQEQSFYYDIVFVLYIKVAKNL
jgi:hypothetical protein